MKRSFLLLAFGVLLNSTLSAQSSVFDVAFEFQAYPTGLIPGLRLEKGFADQHAVHLRLGYNWIRHRDLGEHDDERGDGYGLTVGYRYFFKEDFEGVSLGARNDTWRNTVRWENYDDSGRVSSMGRTKITVVQPTIELGYLIPFSDNDSFFTPTLAFGYEINVKTSGAEVGQGPILLLGFSVGSRY